MNSYWDKDIELEQFVGTRVSTMQRRFLARDPAALAALARLRRGVAVPAGSRPDIWALTVSDLPEALADQNQYSRAERDGVPTAWEQAAHDAITLYAWHQQSKGEPMHQRGGNLGTAVRVLSSRSSSEEAVRRRFHALGAASHHDAQVVHLHSMVSLLRAQSIPLDYSRLARDLRRVGNRNETDRVLLEWGREYHRDHQNREAATTAVAPTDEEDQ